MYIKFLNYQIHIYNKIIIEKLLHNWSGRCCPRNETLTRVTNIA